MAKPITAITIHSHFKVTKAMQTKVAHIAGAATKAPQKIRRSSGSKRDISCKNYAISIL